MQAGLYFGDVKMKTNQPNFGGWLASTEKEPNQLLHTIWLRTREEYTGLIGKSGLKENILVFSGIQIRIKDKEPTSNDLGYTLVLEITNWERIEPDFFDLWEYLKANHLVHGGPDEEDKASFVGGKYAEPIKGNEITLTYGRKQKVSDQVREYIVSAYNKNKAKTGESAENFCKHKINFIIELFDDPSIILKTFQAQVEDKDFILYKGFSDEGVKPKDLHVSDFVNAKDLHVFDFVTANLLPKWVRDLKKKIA